MSNAVTEMKSEPTDLVVVPITPPAMLQMAIERGANLEQLEKFMDLSQRWKDEEAKKAFDAAMAKFSKTAPTLGKDKEVDYTSNGKRTRYSHEDLAGISEVIRPLASKHGLSYRWRTEQPNPGAVKVVCILTHVDGHFTETPLEAAFDTSGGKNTIQGLGSAISYLERYTLKAAFGLAAKEQDDDGNGFGGSDGPINEIQKTEIIQRLRATNSDTIRFLKIFGAKSVDALLASQFAEVDKALTKKETKCKSTK
ncbi:MAG: ERF family protein [Sulfitobacter sp.]|nr:MAG: ERF family protein [Sulfitobacter sp.]